MDDHRAHGAWRAWLGTLPAIGMALLPRITGPLTSSAYAGLISSMGMGFLAKPIYLFPLTIFFLTVSVGALGFGARGRRGYGPLALGIFAGLLFMVGKFIMDFDVAVYSSVAFLIAASLWNSWPIKSARSIPTVPGGNSTKLG